MKELDQAIGFSLTPEQLEYQRLAREFASRELSTQAQKYDTDSKVPIELLKRMQSSGLVNVRLPELCGGIGLKTLEACLIAEELASGCSGIASASEASELAIMPLILFGSDQQKRAMLSPLASESGFAGLFSGCCAGTGMPLRAVHKADRYVLDGTIDGVINANIAEWFLVEAEIFEVEHAAIDPRVGRGTWSAFCLPSKTSGLSLLASPVNLGRRACDLASVTCSGVELAERHRIRFSGDRHSFANQVSCYNSPVIAAGCVGVAKAALTHAIAYAKERHAFGKPIAEHQGLAFMIADMARMIEAARVMVLRAARACDSGWGNPNLAEAAKAYAKETAMLVTTDAVQIFGGYGYSREYPVEKLMRDAKVYQLFAGTDESIKGNLGRHLLLDDRGWQCR
jgi:acyl-CoA dehydrogenase